MPERDPTRPAVPESRTVPKHVGRNWAIWLVPFIAALAGVWVAVTRIMSEGPTITLRFDTAEGLEAGKTKIHYNGVEIGTLDGDQRVVREGLTPNDQVVVLGVLKARPGSKVTPKFQEPAAPGR